MNNYSKLVAVLTVLALTAVLLFVLRSDQEAQTIEFPQKLNHRVMLPPEDSEIESHIEYYQDATTRTSAAVRYKNGYIRVMHYHPEKQTLTKVLDYFFDDPKGHPRLVSESHLLEGGQKLKYHAVYRKDGTLDRKGERQTDGRYKTVYFADDGKTMKVEKLFEDNEVIHSERGFHDDGSTKFTTEWTNAYLTTKFFKQDGTPASVIENHFMVQRGVFLHDDGKTAKAVFAKTSEKLEITYFDDKERPAYTVRVEGGEVRVEAVDGNRILYEQTWKPQFDAKPAYCSTASTLKKVTTFDELSKLPYFRRPESIFYMHQDGSYPDRMIALSSNSPDVTYNLDKEGIVLSVEIESPVSGAKSKPVNQAYEVGDKIAYDQEMFQQKGFECFTIPEKLEVPQIRTFRR